MAFSVLVLGQAGDGSCTADKAPRHVWTMVESGDVGESGRCGTPSVPYLFRSRAKGMDAVSAENVIRVRTFSSDRVFNTARIIVHHIRFLDRLPKRIAA